MRAGSFRVRILAGAVVTALLAVVLAWGSVTLAVEQIVARPDFSVPEPLLAMCRADPASFESLSFGPGRMRGYDERGRAPSGARMDPALADLAPGTSAISRTSDLGRVVVQRTAEAGPCAYVVLEFGPGSRMDTAFRLGAAIGTFLAVFAAGALSYRFTVVPLLARIERIRQAAVQVGGPGYGSADDAVGDDLAEIAGVLDRSHTRIEADRAELVRRQQALEQYLAEIAHDLRTPLGSLVLALQEVDALTDDGGRPAARRALADAAYVSTLVENLHHATRLRHGLDPSRGEADLAEVVRRVEVRFRALGAAQGVEVGASTPEVPVRVACDPSVLERLVGNLTQNASSHGASHVALILEAEAGRFTLTVFDDGPGVPESQLADLALRTFVDDPARRRSTGLGLAIVNEVCRRLGWSARYTRAPEGGLAVTIEGPTHS